MKCEDCNHWSEMYGCLLQEDAPCTPKPVKDTDSLQDRFDMPRGDY